MTTANDHWRPVTGGFYGLNRRQAPGKSLILQYLRRMRALIERIHYKGAAGPVFFLKSPRIALGAACVRVGIPHLRIHDLRHLFATHAIESGVDVPTVAKWLGHKDGGALAMRTYGHIRDDHSLQSIKKL